MGAARIFGILLIVGGVLALVYGGFSFTEETHDARVGGVELSIEDKERVNVPVWAGVAAIFAGGALLFFGGGRRRS